MKSTRSTHPAANGGKWIRQDKRLAIYMRDGLACAYCSEGIEEGARLTLDHIQPHSQGGTNDSTNLVTACHRCNSSRGNRAVEAFAASVAGYLNHGVTAEAIVEHIETRRALPLDRAEAKRIMDRRSSFAETLASLRAQ